MNSHGENPPRVVVGIDFSSHSMAAARWTARWIPRDSELVLVHALVIPEMGSRLPKRYPPSATLLENARAGADRRLRELSASIGFPRVWIQVGEGRPAEVIARAAREFTAEIVVVGMHGEGGRTRGYPGRTADQLVRISPVPVLLATGTLQEAPHVITVALTSSSVSPHIVEWTRRFHQRFDSRVAAIHVIGSKVLAHVLSMAAVTQGSAPITQHEIDRLFATEREGWIQQLVGAGIPPSAVTCEIAFGEVAEQVLAAAKRHAAGMIVMGSHAGPVRRALLGSSASAVLRHSEIPVLVVLEPQDSTLRNDSTTESFEKTERLAGVAG